MHSVHLSVLQSGAGVGAGVGGQVVAFVGKFGSGHVAPAMLHEVEPSDAVQNMHVEFAKHEAQSKSASQLALMSKTHLSAVAMDVDVLVGHVMLFGMQTLTPVSLMAVYVLVPTHHWHPPAIVAVTHDVQGCCKASKK